MDLTNVEVVSIDQVLNNHLQWLLITLPIIWSALAGAFIRLLLIHQEPLHVRTQNALAGVLLAVVLTATTAELLSDGKYAAGYALVYGMLGREIFVSIRDFVQQKARTLLLALFLHSFSFLEYIKSIATKETDNHDDTKHH